MTEKEMARFLSKFKQGKPNNCWEWEGFQRVNGYGGFNININGKEKMKLPHRLSYEHFIGPIPEGLCVLHKCDNRGCVNPNHLFLGTQKDNMQDCAKKGRTLKGEKCSLYGRILSKEQEEKRVNNLSKKIRSGTWKSAKLTESQVREIRNSNLPKKELGEIYGVHRRTISRIKLGQVWGWLS